MECKLCTPMRTQVSYAGVMTELEKGPRGLRRGRGARERILSASQQLFRDQASAPIEQAAELGAQLAEQLLASGASEILKALSAS